VRRDLHQAALPDGHDVTHWVIIQRADCQVRFAAMGKGKSGGVRVIYYCCGRDTPVYALLVYGKSERADLTADQRRSVAAFAAAIKVTRKDK
jgi:hypothetical protein